MVTRLPPELQLTLIEHMAHLTSSDYGEVPRDLLLLGFIPEDKADLIEDSGIVDVLADIYGAWTSGGGVAAINVNQVISQLQDLTAKKGNLFQVCRIRVLIYITSRVSHQQLLMLLMSYRSLHISLILRNHFQCWKGSDCQMIPSSVSSTHVCRM
jgi:hypothetical protein